MNILEVRNIYNDALIFCSLFEMKSFSAAARKLGVDQSTVSRRIQALEHELELQLIRRNTRRVEFTGEGVNFYQIFIGQESLLRKTIEDFKYGKTNLVGKIRVAIPFGIANHIISPKIAGYMRENPLVSLEIFYQNRKVDLIADAIDFAVVRQIPTQQTVKIKKIYSADIQLFCTPKYITRYGEPKSLDDLGSHLITSYINDDFTIENPMKVENKDGKISFIPINSRLGINSTEAGKEIIKEGHAIVIGLDGLYVSEEKCGEVVKVLPDYRFAHTEFYLVRLNNNHGALAKHFMQFIEDCFSEYKNTHNEV